MPDAPTPGQVCYAAYYHTWLRHRHRSVMLTWTQLTAYDQHAWDTAAQAVLEACAALCPICAAELDRCNAKEPPHV